MSKAEATVLLEEVSKRFGKGKIIASVEDENEFSDKKDLIESYADEVLFMNCSNTEAVINLTDLKTIIMSDEQGLIRISTSEDLLESKMDFSKFKLNTAEITGSIA